LLENAIKFSPKGATVTIASQDSDEGVLFSVQNPGPAISAKTIEKIAKPFSIDEDIMHHSQGSGLGLSLCQALLKTHGSALEFEYRNGENTVAFALTTSVPSTDDPSV
jgi:K+-sensing histidine kinase KdpD